MSDQITMDDTLATADTTLPPTYAATIETQIPDEIPMSQADVPLVRDDNGQEEDAMNRINRIHIIDNPTAWFGEGFDLDGIDERASIERGRELITEALREAYPHADISITEGYAIQRISCDVDAAERIDLSHITNDIDHIIHTTWASHDWIVYADQDEPEA